MKAVVPSDKTIVSWNVPTQGPPLKAQNLQFKDRFTNDGASVDFVLVPSLLQQLSVVTREGTMNASDTLRLLLFMTFPMKTSFTKWLIVDFVETSLARVVPKIHIWKIETCIRLLDSYGLLWLVCKHGYARSAKGSAINVTAECFGFTKKCTFIEQQGFQTRALAEIVLSLQQLGRHPE